MVEQQSSKLPARVRFLLSLLLFYISSTSRSNLIYLLSIQTKSNNSLLQAPTRPSSGSAIRYRSSHKTSGVSGKSLKWALVSRTKPTAYDNCVQPSLNLNFLSSLLLLNSGVKPPFELNPFSVFILSSRKLISNLVRLSPDVASLIIGPSFTSTGHNALSVISEVSPSGVSLNFRFLAKIPRLRSSSLARESDFTISSTSHLKLKHLRLNLSLATSFRSLESQRGAVFSLQQLSWKRRTGRNVPRFYVLTKERFDQPFYGARFKPGIGFVTSLSDSTSSTVSAFDFYHGVLRNVSLLTLSSTVGLYPKRVFTAISRFSVPKNSPDTEISPEKRSYIPQRFVSRVQYLGSTPSKRVSPGSLRARSRVDNLTADRLGFSNSVLTSSLRSRSSSAIRRRLSVLSRSGSIQGGAISKVLGLNLLKTSKSLLISDKFGPAFRNYNSQELARLLKRLKARFGRSGRGFTKLSPSSLLSSSRSWVDTVLPSRGFRHKNHRFETLQGRGPSGYGDLTLPSSNLRSVSQRVSKARFTSPSESVITSGTQRTLVRFFTQWRFLSFRLPPRYATLIGQFGTRSPLSTKSLGSPLRRQVFWRALRNSLKSRRRVKTRLSTLHFESQSSPRLSRSERLSFVPVIGSELSDTATEPTRSSASKYKHSPLPESSFGSSTDLALRDLQLRATRIRSMSWTNLKVRDRLNRLILMVTPVTRPGQVSVVGRRALDSSTTLFTSKIRPVGSELAGLTLLTDVFTFAKSCCNPLLFKYLGLRNAVNSLPVSTFESSWSTSVSALIYSTHQLDSFAPSDRNLARSISSLDTPMVLKVAVRRRIAYTLGSDIRSSNINYFYGRFLSEFIEHTTGRHSFVKLNPAIESGLTFADKAKLASWEPRIVGFKRIMGPKIFIVEALHLVCLSLRLKDPTFLANWIRAMMNRLSFWKQRLVFRYLKYLLRYLFEPYFSELGIRGVKFQLKGKISVAGNARTRTLFYKIGNTSQSQMDSKVAYDLSFVETFTGILGFKLWFFF